MTKFRRGNREFLNRPGFHEDATLSYNLSIGSGGYFSGSINVRDCGENICLELSVHTDEWMENSEFKIDTMIRLLRDAKKDLRLARRAWKKITKAAKKKK